jgi:molybdenum cofactor cytidylyltransferase
MNCAIVLAAGMSRRMGAQKVLLPFGGKTVISHIVDQIAGSLVDKIIVVAGDEGDKVRGQLSGRDVSIVINPDSGAEMLSSVRCGILVLPQQCEGVLVALGDQPGITTGLVNGMVNAFKTANKGILVPVCQGKRGHPILFSSRYCNEILTRYDDIGLRGLAETHADDVFELNVSSPAVLCDMDCPEDYKRELSRLQEDDAVRPPGAHGRR